MSYCATHEKVVYYPLEERTLWWTWLAAGRRIPFPSSTITVGYVRGDRGIRREPTSAHFQFCLVSSIPSGVSISFSDRKSSSSWWLVCKTPWTLEKVYGLRQFSTPLLGEAQFLVGSRECHPRPLERRSRPIGHYQLTHPRGFFR